MLRLLYDLGARAQALYFLRWMQPPAVTPADAILHMQILLESDLLSQAFNYQRLRFASAATPAEVAVRRTLLEHLFQFFLASTHSSHSPNLSFISHHHRNTQHATRQPVA